MENPQIRTNTRAVFPEKCDEPFRKILEKYGLSENQEELFRKISEAKTPEEKERIIDASLERKTVLALKEVADGVVALKDFGTALSERLNIPEEKSKKIANELEKEVLVFVEKVPVEEAGEEVEEIREDVIPSIRLIRPIIEAVTDVEIVKPLDTVPSEEKPSQKKEKVFPKKTPITPKTNKKSDVYREPLE